MKKMKSVILVSKSMKKRHVSKNMSSSQGDAGSNFDTMRRRQNAEDEDVAMEYNDDNTNDASSTTMQQDFKPLLVVPSGKNTKSTIPRPRPVSNRKKSDETVIPVGRSICSIATLCFLVGGVAVFLLLEYGGARRYFTKSGSDATTDSDNLRSNAKKTDKQFDNNSKEEGNKKKDTGTDMKSLISRRMQISTWNIAAINNNPFEYWITFKENPAYEDLMVRIENFLEDPGDKDVTIPNVFTQTMFDELDNRLTTTAGWVSVKKYWDDDFSKRSIVKGFMKDPTLGSKRLASMPDRITNTLNTEDGKTYFRPTVINMYEDDLGTQEKWWSAWEKFMFETTMKIKNRDGVVEDKKPFELLQPISKKKYPDITLEEEKDSLPLQTMCGAIFDAILVHMMNTLSEPNVWQELKRTMVKNLNKQKIPHTLDILERVYGDSDIITLQEVSSSFIDLARNRQIGQKFHIVQPADLDAVRDQNSVICLKKSTFPSGDQSTEVTSFVEDELGEANKKMLGKGDLLAITTENSAGDKFLIASFHGDTNGLATIPVTDAIAKALVNPSNKAVTPDHKLIFGLDANTYEKGKPNKTQDVLEYGRAYVKHGLTSCWGDEPDPKNYTTYNARTYLQPQLNKACKQTEKREKGDVNPKDFILFPQNTFKVIQTFKDNTGKKLYIEDMAFPTLEFPSDHGILTTILEPTE